MKNPMNPDFVVKPEQLETVMLAGNALLTVQSKPTGDHKVFKIIKDKNKLVNKWWVKLGDRIIGRIEHGDFLIGNTTTEPRVEQKVFKWLFDNKQNITKLANQVNIFHNGLCCKCGRELTDPLSISLAIGPTCRGYKNLILGS